MSVLEAGGSTTRLPPTQWVSSAASDIIYPSRSDGGRKRRDFHWADQSWEDNF
jgi:hypothetical protein